MKAALIAPFALTLSSLLLPAPGLAQDKPAAAPPAAPQPPKPQPPPPADAPKPTAAPAILPHVEVRGTGPIPLILIPAFVCDWTIYDTFMTRNADAYTMYAVTLAGFGKSDPPPAPADDVPYSIAPWLDNAVQGIVRLIDDRKLDKPVVLGVSTGGHIALRVGLAAPDRVRAVVTFNGLPAIPLHDTLLLPQATRDRIVREEFGAFWKSCPEADWTHLQEDWIHSSFPDPERAKAVLAAAAGLPKSTSGRYMLEYFASDLSPQLSSLNLPVLAVSSLPRPTNSQFQTLKDAWKAAFAKLPQAKIAYFEDSGEFLTEDSPAQVDAAIKQFLDGKPVEGKAAPEKPPQRPSNVQPVPGHPSPPPEIAPPDHKPTGPK